MGICVHMSVCEDLGSSPWDISTRFSEKPLGSCWFYPKGTQSPTQLSNVDFSLLSSWLEYSSHRLAGCNCTVHSWSPLCFSCFFPSQADGWTVGSGLCIVQCWTIYYMLVGPYPWFHPYSYIIIHSPWFYTHFFAVNSQQFQAHLGEHLSPGGCDHPLDGVQILRGAAW